MVRRALQVQVRGGLLGARGILLILGFVAVVVGASLAVAFSLQAAGVPGPALAGNAFGAACLVVGGPLLMGALRRIMLANRTGTWLLVIDNIAKPEALRGLLPAAGVHVLPARP